MWKAIPDMSDEELRDARTETFDRHRTVAGHNKARRLQERLDAINAEISKRADEVERRGRFVIEIEPGNAAMSTVDDVADALHRLANRIGGQGWVGEGKVGDVNGNTVGRWTFHDHN